MWEYVFTAIYGHLHLAFRPFLACSEPSFSMEPRAWHLSTYNYCGGNFSSECPHISNNMRSYVHCVMNLEIYETKIQWKKRFPNTPITLKKILRRFGTVFIVYQYVHLKIRNRPKTLKKNYYQYYHYVRKLIWLTQTTGEKWCCRQLSTQFAAKPSWTEWPLQQTNNFLTDKMNLEKERHSSDKIFFLRQNLKQSEWNLTLYANFIDFNKVFASIYMIVWSCSVINHYTPWHPS